MNNADSLMNDLRWKHTPDSIKEEIRRELKYDYGYSEKDIKEVENEIKWYD